MSSPGPRVDVSEQPLDVGAIVGEASDRSCGGIGVFVGVVRDTPSTRSTPPGPVVALEYEAHPALAVPALRAAALTAATRWNLKRVVAVHRSGRCELGDPTVVVACAAPHRAEALEACRWLIDEIKATVPIWKKEIFADGSVWVGTEGGARV